jgi:uncharacterized protein (TIGR00255 family)
MTGYGRASASLAAGPLVVEIRTVNHRFLEIKVRGASLGGGLEDQIGARLRAAFERGAVQVSISAGGADPGAPRLDRQRAHQAFAVLSALAVELSLPPPSLADLLAHPGVIAHDPGAPAVDDAGVLELVDVAAAQVRAMRKTEGAALAKDLSSRLGNLTSLAAELERLAGQGAAAVAERLHERVRRLLGQLDPVAAIEPSRLAQEIAQLADRSDITEELVRLGSHLQQATGLLEQAGAVGRRLEFLLQEIGRELNTVGAKAWSAAISARVVEAKSELEKLREQAQNVE